MPPLPLNVDIQHEEEEPQDRVTKTKRLISEVLEFNPDYCFSDDAQQQNYTDARSSDQFYYISPINFYGPAEDHMTVNDSQVAFAVEFDSSIVRSAGELLDDDRWEFVDVHYGDILNLTGEFVLSIEYK